MSANPATNNPVDLNGLSTAPAGGTVTGGSAAVTASSYEQQAQARRKITRKGSHGRPDNQGFVGVDGFNNAPTFLNNSLAVLGNTNQGVILRDRAGVAPGLLSDGSAAAIGGAVIDASKAKQVVVTLGYNSAFNAGSATVPKRFIPRELLADLGKNTTFNTASWLSRGADAYTGTTANDLAILGKGNDRAVMGSGDDVAYINAAMDSKQINLDQGKDKIVIEDDAFEGSRGFLKVWDFNNKQDKLLLDVSKRDVRGVGTTRLVVSSGKKKIFIDSEASVFSRSSIEYI